MGEEAGIEAVLDALYAERGLDFRLYRRSTIAHRLRHRLAAVRAPDYRAYLHMLASAAIPPSSITSSGTSR